MTENEIIKLRNELKTLLEKKEKYENSLKSLEDLWAKQEITEKHYSSLKEDYESKLREVESKIKDLKETINQKLKDLLTQKSKLVDKLDLLTVRFKVGEINERDFSCQKTKIEDEIKKLNENIEKLQVLLKANKPKDLWELYMYAFEGLIRAIQTKESKTIEVQKKRREPKRKVMIGRLRGVDLIGAYIATKGVGLIIFGILITIAHPLGLLVFIGGLFNLYFAYSLWNFRDWARKALIIFCLISIIVCILG